MRTASTDLLCAPVWHTYWYSYSCNHRRQYSYTHLHKYVTRKTVKEDRKRSDVYILPSLLAELDGLEEHGLTLLLRVVLQPLVVEVPLEVVRVPRRFLLELVRHVVQLLRLQRHKESMVETNMW